MPIGFDRLDRVFRKKLAEVIFACDLVGITLRVTTGERTPLEQAKLYRQGRSNESIDRSMRMLQAAGADRLARLIADSGPQTGPRVTNALPGDSWHQWGEAADVVWLVMGKVSWDIDRKVGGLNGYREYAKTCQRVGLSAGGLWSTPDWPHCQMRADAAPSRTLSWVQIQAAMVKRFNL